MSIFRFKKSDTIPALIATLDNIYDAPSSLIGASILFRMRTLGAATNTVEADAVVVDANTVKYVWQPSDSLDIGLYSAEFVVTYPNGSIRSYPNLGFMTIEIVSNLS